MKTEQLQIRVTARQKAELRRRARAAGQDLSAFVLARALPPLEGRFRELVHALRAEAERPFVLASLNDLLTGLTASEVSGLPPVDLTALPPEVRCHVAAMVEQAAVRVGGRPPAWVMEIEALPEPWFATPLRGLRLHLLQASPVAFRRRNLFVDSALGDRV